MTHCTAHNALHTTTQQTHHYKSKLHPALPLLRLRSREQLNAPRALVGIVLERLVASNEQANVGEPKQGGAVVLVAVVRLGPVVAQPGYEQNARHVGLGARKVLAALPVQQDRLEAAHWLFFNHALELCRLRFVGAL
jgi:hypothetical protein